MATPRLQDHLQSFKFHLLDIAVTEFGDVVAPVLIPIIGFSAITAPEMSAELETITEGNNEFPRKVIKGGSVGTITLSRGSQFFDSDYYRWVISCIKGAGTNSLRRTLLLVHFMNRDVLDLGVGEGVVATALAANVALAGSRYSFTETAALEGSLIGVGAAVGLLPAKVWMMRGCLATRVKVGSDFDASEGGVSIMELDIEAETFEEFSVAS